MAETSGKIEKRYARALFEVTAPERWDDVKWVLAEIQETLAQNPELAEVLENPGLSFARRSAVIREVCVRLRPEDRELANFFVLLVSNNRLRSLPGIIEQFALMVDIKRNTIVLEVTSARDLPDDERAALQHDMQVALSRAVSIQWLVDQNILGGLIIKAGDRVLDSSVAGSLNRIKSQLLV